MANFSDDPYDLLDDEDVKDDLEDSLSDDDSDESDDPALDLDNPGPSSEGESDALNGGSASTPTGENTGDAMDQAVGDDPIGSGKTIGDLINEGERAKYDTPPEGANVPEVDALGKVPSPLDELDGPSEDDLEEIELEELGKKN